MSSIDERVVAMKFDNAQFERGTKETRASLDALSKSLKLEGAAKGLAAVQSASKNFSLAGIASGVESLSSKFSAMSVVGVAAIATIVNKATNAGLQLAKSLTISPITAGLHEYETQLNSVQTILANTGLEGASGMAKVNAALNDLNHYSDLTIYNFSEMARNIGTFTAAGVKLDVATSAIKGIANLAAVSGSSADQASTAMYQLSQAIASGSVKLQDWNSVVNAGLGGKVFQEGLLRTARAHGVNVDKIIKKEGSFRQSLQTGWLSSKILTETLSQFTGDMTNAQLKQLGYTDKQIVAIQKMAKTAQKAATQVKTMSGLFSTLQEAAGSGWASTWQIIFGDIGEASSLFTGLNNVIGGFISASANARNKVLGDWKAMGGRTALFDGIRNVFQALFAIIKPIREAFREIFPPTTGKQLAEMSKNFRDFTAKLKIGAATADNIKRTFKGLFAVFHIGVEVIKAVVGFIAGFFSVVQGGSGNVFSLTAGLGDFLVKLNEWITGGDRLANFFKMLDTARDAVIAPLIKFVTLLVDAFVTLFKGDTHGFIDKIKNSFSAFAPLVASIQAGFASLQGGVGKVIAFLSDKLHSFVDSTQKGFSSLKSALATIAGYLVSAAQNVSNFLSSMGSSAMAPIIRLVDTLAQKFQNLKDHLSFKLHIDTSGLKDAGSGGASLLEGIGLRVKEVWAGVGRAFAKVGEIAGPALQAIGSLFKTIADKISEYIKGLNFGDAVALLNTGFFILLYRSLKTFTDNVGSVFKDVGGLIRSIKGVFDTLTSTLKTMQQDIKANIVLKIALAVGILAAAVYVLSTIDPKALGKALAALTAMFAQLVITLSVFSKFSLGNQTGMARTIGSLILLAIAIDILTSAVKKLSDLSWSELTKGLIGVGGLLAGLALFTKFAEVDKGGIKSSAGLILLAIAIKLLVGSVTDLGSTDTGVLIKGIAALSTIFAALAIMTKVLNTVSGIPQAAAGLLILSAALAALSIVLRIYAAMDWSTILKGLAAVVLAISAIGLAMRLVPGPAAAAALVIVSAALVVLAGVLKVLGAMSLGEIAKSVITLALALGIIAIAVSAMEFALPGAQALIVVAAALLILTPVLMLLGSMDLASIGKALLAIAGVFIIIGLAGLLLTPVIPTLAALGVVLLTLGQAMLLAGVGFIAFAAGFAILATVGVAGIGVLVAAFTAVLNLIPLFAQQVALGLRAFAVVIAQSGPVLVNAIATVLMSILQAIDRVMPKFFDTMRRLVIGMVVTVTGLIPLIAAAGVRMIIRLLQVIDQNVPKIVPIAVSIITKFLKGISDGLPKIIDAGAKLIIKFVNGVADGIRNNSAAMGRAGGNLASAMIEGMARGLLGGLQSIVDAATRVAKSAFDAAKRFLHIASPSKKFFELGKFSAVGMANGLDKYSVVVGKAAEGVGSNAVETLRKSISGLDTIVTSDINFVPTITPVLDLGDVKKEAGKLGDLLGKHTIAVDAAYSDAANASAAIRNSQAPEHASETAQANSNSFIFNQTNNSPKALSPAEIYRQTRNQISVTKGVLESK